jgi:hypothetical protein
MFKCYCNLGIITIFLLAGCSNDGPTGGGDGNQNIVLLKDRNANPLFKGDYRMGVQVGEIVYYARPLGLCHVDASYRVVRDSVLQVPESWKYLYITVNRDGSRLLAVKSMYNDVAIGSLHELDLKTGFMSEILDSSYSVSSAKYLSDGVSFVYYSYAHPKHGYIGGYFLSPGSGGVDSLLLPLASEVGPEEVVHGFDVGRSDRVLLIPVHRNDTTAMLVEFDIHSKSCDTLPCAFPNQFVWARYNATGDNILYSSYPSGVGWHTTCCGTEVGILDRSTGAKQIPDVNTNPGFQSVSIFPNWSDGERAILYGNTWGPMIEPPGTIGNYSLYALTHIPD